MSTRRFVIQCLGLLPVSIATAQQSMKAVKTPGDERTIELFNTHTHESVRVVYKRGKDYIPEALAKLRNVLRDWRNDESHEMDPGVFDQLVDLAATAGVEPSYEIISGYRSPASNSMLAAVPGSGVSKKSMHMQGRAMDVRLKGVTVERLRDLALAAKRGGVGYYRRSQFVHIDTGPFRTWNG